MKNDTPVSNRTPGQRYRHAAMTVNTHREMMADENMVRALDVALLEYQRRLAATTEPALAAPAWFKLQGAQEFVAVLKTLSEEPPQPAIVDVNNLAGNRG